MERSITSHRNFSTIVVDKFSDILVVESPALGIDRLKMQILDALTDILKKDGIQVRGIYGASYVLGVDASELGIRQVEFRTQSTDYPILWAADSSYYLKFYIFQNEQKANHTAESDRKKFGCSFLL